MSSRRRHNKAINTSREEKSVRKWMRRQARQAARALIRKGKSDAIDRERGTQGWVSW